jgi:hypothetical protein
MNPQFFRKYIDIIEGPEAVQQDVDAEKYGTYDRHSQAAQAAKPEATALPPLVTPTAEQLKARYKDVGSVVANITSQPGDANTIGTMRNNTPFARLVSSVKGLTGPAYTGRDDAAETAPVESGWEYMARALAMPAGRILFLKGDVAPGLLYKLNPWAQDPQLVQLVAATLPDYNSVQQGNIG